jgi:hypothetical protein
MRKIVLLAALAAVLAPSLVSAGGPGVDGFGFRKRSAARAAPWFLYWPQSAYWQTPAPTGYGYGTPGVMTPGPYMGQIGANQYPHVQTSGPTGFDY